ncbi:serine hydrolase domain-containing protein [Parvularcula marina]|uniref:Class A beta-lactamase-related serine hydrolase n=1 Tax=Parvularcula marina TaxID=2292771 RepID=A0A371RHR4_9PROT|nr:serine hydrolase domain-containing protein [Parvularcula marina]RFB04980.1 class A beta-lactamase-related serine hydrolase [Parvularcula marina]
MRRFARTGLTACVCAPLFLAVTSAEPLSGDDPRIIAFETRLMDREARGNPDAARRTIEEALAIHHVPGAAVAIIEDGKIVWAKGYGTRLAGEDMPIDGETVFSAGSISKMINAGIILRMVDEGLLDLDRDVNDYLTSWKVEDSAFTAEKKVTLRMILSHTAGFSIHGFPDFEPGEELPSALQTLNGEPPAKQGPVRLIFTPGERMQYSGGGITVSQVLIEDVTGLSYPEAARKYVLDPLGMTRSTFVNPLPATHGNIARAHDRYGVPAALPRGWEAMPELAASGLWTSAEDMARFVIALEESTNGEGDFLSTDLAQDMMTRVPMSWHGLGPRLNGEGETRVFHHGGANTSYRAHMEGHLASGDGIIILTNSTNGRAAWREIRKSAEEAFDWPVTAETGFEEPSFEGQ